jgi:O-antigen/teichoic acid export membrane protein
VKKDLIFTFITEFLVVIFGLLVYRIASQILPNNGFSEYALSRRIISLVQPALLLGLGVGIPRYIAFSYKNKLDADGYFLAGGLIIFTLGFTSALILNLFSETFAYLFFSSKEYDYLILPISMIIVGLLLHGICYSYFRGNLKMVYANILQIINMSFVPLLAFYLASDVKGVLTFTGAIIIINSIFFLIMVFFMINKNFAEVDKKAKILINYGIQRLPADFGMSALLGLPAVITSHLVGVKEAGYVAFSVSLLNMAGAIFAPLGLVMLPKASMLVVNKEFDRLNNLIKRIIKITFSTTLIGLIIFELFAEQIFELYLGWIDQQLVMTARLIFIGSIGYTLYVALRSIVDAIYYTSKNTVNVMISLIIFIIMSFISFITLKNFFIEVSFIISIWSLGINTLKEINKHDKRSD